ncbi:hypothetical protein AMK59_1751, partial [Oryctes borbonicus]
MKTFLLIVAVYVTCLLADDGYTTKYDNVSLKNIINNKRLLKNYSNCLLEKGICSPDGAELKKVLPDVIQTGCAKCNEKQRNGSKIILNHLIGNEPEIYKQL